MRPRERPGVSLERALSKLGLASRAEARRLIAAGRVAVDGRVALDPRAPVVPEAARVCIDGVEAAPPARIVIALHKPRGVVTTRSDPEGRPTVYSLLEGLDTHVVPVGRLDLATSGLLLLTNDTRLADWLTDPRSRVPRIYLVTARGRVTEEDIARLIGGIGSRGERLAASAATLRKASARESHVVVTLTEGRNREVRRLFEAIGHEVTRLRRVQIGGVDLGTLAPGAWRGVGDGELRRAFPGYRSGALGASGLPCGVPEPQPRHRARRHGD
ncbi:MAG: rRNA pseudouridine synthase [Acidobacteria bacterium]|nr:rRNA pseudouridine synthase [Acidobacteriota bacterium]